MFFIYCHSLSLHNTSTHSHTQSNTTTQQHIHIWLLLLFTYYHSTHTHTHHNKTTLLSFSIVLFGHHSFINALSYNSYTFIHSPTHNTFLNTTHHKHKHPYFTYASFPYTVYVISPSIHSLLFTKTLSSILPTHITTPLHLHHPSPSTQYTTTHSHSTLHSHYHSPTHQYTHTFQTQPQQHSPTQTYQRTLTHLTLWHLICCHS